MRRIAAVVAATSIVVGACSVGGDRYLPKFGDGQRIVKAADVGALAVAPSGAIYFAEGAAVSVVNPGSRPRAVAFFAAPGEVTGLAVEPNGSVLVAARGATLSRVRGTESQQVWTGDDRPVRVAVSEGRPVLGIATTVRSADDEVISGGWTDPIVVAGRGKRIWVADNARRGEKEFVARGREKDRPKRRRFATALPSNTDPSGMALLEDELLVCSRARRNVVRLHIGLDEVARRREALEGVVCSNGIAVAPDGALITATRDAIYRYPPR